MCEYRAKILGLNPGIEEEVTIQVNDIIITCFASSCAYKLKIGHEYTVTIEMLDFELAEQKESKETSIKRIGNNYTYQLKGKLSGGRVDVGLLIYDEFLESDYAYLDGNYIRLDVERLDVGFH